jgi:hypothetical protein
MSLLLLIWERLYAKVEDPSTLVVPMSFVVNLNVRRNSLRVVLEERYVEQLSGIYHIRNLCKSLQWILKPSYLEASSIAGKFVDEKDHEWGNSLTDKTFMDPRIWPKAPSFWREERSKGSTGAFENWNFFVHPKSVPPPDMCKKIIEAAGGIVITLDKKMNMSTFQSTNRSEKLFAVVAQGITTRDSWAKKFKHHKIQCINAGFLIDYITKDQSNPPQISDYLM